MKTIKRSFMPSSSTPLIKKSSVQLAVALALGIGVFSSTSLAQQTTTWTGGGGDNNWGTSANWNNGTPTVATNTTVNFAGSTRLSPFFNYNNFDQMGSIFFSSGAGAFTLGGNSIKVATKIENSGSSLQTVNFASLVLNNGTATEINPVSGNLAIASGVFLDTPQLRIFGNNGNTVTFSNVIAAGSVSTASVAINQNSNVVYTAANTYSGDTFVNQGKLQFGAGGSANNSAIRIGDSTGAIAAEVDLLPAAGGLTLNSVMGARSGNSGTITLASQNTSGTNTLTNQIYADKALTIQQTAGGTLAITQARSGVSTTTGMDIKGNTVTLQGTNATQNAFINISGDIYNSTGSGVVTLGSAGLLTATFSGNNTFSGGLNNTSGGNTVIGRTNTAFGTGTIALTTAAQYSTAVFATDSNDIFGNNITGAVTTSGISNLVSDRATAGAGVTHTLGTTNGLGSSGGQFLFQAGSNVTSGTAGLAFAASTIGANGTTGNTVLNAIGTSVSYAGLTATTPSSTTVSGAINFNLAGSGTGLAGSATGSGTVTGAIANSAVNGSATNTVAVNKAGPSTWSLGGSNTYTGSTTLSGGTLALNYTTNNTSKLADGAALVLNGGTLQLSGGSHVETIGSLSITGGGNQITRPSGTSTLATGGALNASIQQASTTSGTNSITLPSGVGVFVGQSISGTGVATGTTIASVSGNVITLSAAPTSTNATTTLTIGFNAGAVNFATGVATTTSQNNFSGILSSRLTVGSAGAADFAANDGSGGLVGYTSYTALPASSSSNTVNYLVTGSFTTTAAQSVNALKITSTGAGQSLTLNTGNFTLRNNGLLFTGANDYSIGGAGTLNVTSGPLVIHQYGAGTLTTGSLGSNIEKYGPGTLILSGANSNTSNAALTINQGTVQFSANTQLGLTTATAGNVILNGGTLVANTAGGDISLINNTGTTPAGRGVTVGLGGGTLDVIGGNSLTISGVISGSTAGTGSTYSAPLTFGSASSNGTFVLSGANTYRGGTILAGGTAQLGVAEVANTSGPLGQYGVATAGAQYNYITFAGGTLQHTATNTTDYSGRFAQVANQSFRIDTNNQPVIYATGLAGAASTLTKSGTGTLTLTGNSTYTGATTINGGTLAASATNGSALNTTSSVTVNSGGTLLIGAANQINNTAAITLNANSTSVAAINTGGFSETVGALTLSTTSVIDLGAGSSILNFAASNGNTWSGSLQIWNYTGAATTAGADTDQVFFGTDNTALTSSQLAGISFYSGSGTGLLGSGASFLAGGNGQIGITAVPEPSTWVGAGLITSLVAWSQRKRLARMNRRAA